MSGEKTGSNGHAIDESALVQMMLQAFKNPTVLNALKEGLSADPHGKKKMHEGDDSDKEEER